MANPSKGTGFSLKDHLFNRERVQYLANQFHQADKKFDAPRFVRVVTKPFKQLELKERIHHIAATLEEFLPEDFGIATNSIVNALPPPLDPTKTDDDFGDFIFAPLGEFVARNGLEKKRLRVSLKTLKEITQRFSMEDAIRRFINAFPEPTMRELAKWSKHKNYHVRRLVSEGTRPLLPWSGRLVIDGAEPLPLLDTLHADPTRYVTRSVANHLNDIAKSDPKLVLNRLKAWKKLGQQDANELAWMSKHALRTLVKQGHRGALQFLGFRANPKIKVHNFEVFDTTIKPGGMLRFAFDIEAQRNESLMVDFVIDFVKADGSWSPKVHKLKQLTMHKGETTHLKKQHRLMANATTYTLYPGVHRLSLQINGALFGSHQFEVGH